MRNMRAVENILLQLDFKKIYDEVELFNKSKVNIRKYSRDDFGTLELIENPNARINGFHICFKGPVPKFLGKHTLVQGEPFDKSLELFFVYIGDSIYFEFVRNK